MILNIEELDEERILFMEINQSIAIMIGSTCLLAVSNLWAAKLFIFFAFLAHICKQTRPQMRATSS